MRFGNHEPRPDPARKRGGYRPAGEELESKLLLATIDLGNPTTNTSPLPLIASGVTASGSTGYGIDMASTTAGIGAGFSTADLGDINGDGFDDFAIGAPGVTTNNLIIPGTPTPTPSASSAAYIVFGSRAAGAAGQPGTTSDWLLNTPEQRVGNLATLGAQTQTNPIDGNAGFAFDGIKIISSANPNSEIGASVADAGMINGMHAFLVGAPGGFDATGPSGTSSGNPGSGRAYLIFGPNTAYDALANHTLDVDTPASFGGLSVVTFVVGNNSGAISTGLLGSGLVGTSLAGVGDVITDGINDIAIGAPGAFGSEGAVFLISGTAIQSASTTIDLTTVGQTGGTAGAVFVGTAAGDRAGFSLAGAGSVDGALNTSNQKIADFLIGAPGANGTAGAAYLIYGAPNLASFATTANGFNNISLSTIGVTGSTTPRGLAIAGTAAGDATGYSVSSAGDFNGDGFADILVGSPGAGGLKGRADVIYGSGGNPPTGQDTLGAFPIGIQNATLTGGVAGDFAGFSVGFTGAIGTSTPAPLGNPILIGAPGYSGASGTVYVIPPNSDLEGSQSLLIPSIQTVAATQLTFTTAAGAASPAYFGASVSGRFVTTGLSTTADNDTFADFIVGTPGYSATTAAGAFAGGGQIVEGGRIQPLSTPTPSGITTQIGVGTPFAPFNLNATSPATLAIYVFSSTAVIPNFRPVTDIVPASVVVNGVPFPTATITQDPVDENKDNIPDAIITITPRSALNLLNTTTQLTIVGLTTTGQRWSGKATIAVTGGNSGGGGGGGGTGGAVGGTGSGLPIGTIALTEYIPPFGPDTYVPSLTTLSQLSSYKPIPARVALEQYLPARGFTARLLNFFYPRLGKTYGNTEGNSTQGAGTGGHGRIQLGHRVFTREKYKPGKTYTFTHPIPVVPTNLQTERFAGQPRKVK